MSDETLCALVQSYPAIWQRGSEAFKDRRRKENAFMAVATGLSKPVDAVMKRWLALREKYRKEKLKIEKATRSGAGALSFNPWCLTDALSFLDTVQLKRRTFSNVVASSEAGGTQEEAGETLDEAGETQEEAGETQEEAGGSQVSVCGWANVLMEEEADVQHAVGRPGPSARSQPSTSHAPPSASTSGSPSPAVSSRSKKSKKMEDPTVPLLTRMARIAEATSAAVVVDAASAQDDCDVYGRHVALMLRSMTPQNRREAIHAINDSLYRYTE